MTFAGSDGMTEFTEGMRGFADGMTGLTGGWRSLAGSNQRAYVAHAKHADGNGLLIPKEKELGEGVGAEEVGLGFAAADQARLFSVDEDFGRAATAVVV